MYLLQHEISDYANMLDLLFFQSQIHESNLKHLPLMLVFWVFESWYLILAFKLAPFTKYHNFNSSN